MRVKAVFIGKQGETAGEYTFDLNEPPREGRDSGDLAASAKKAFDEFSRKHTGFRLVGDTKQDDRDVSVRFVKVSD